jgi:hypothetical protein
MADNRAGLCCLSRRDGLAQRCFKGSDGQQPRRLSFSLASRLALLACEIAPPHGQLGKSSRNHGCPRLKSTIGNRPMKFDAMPVDCNPKAVIVHCLSFFSPARILAIASSNMFWLSDVRAASWICCNRTAHSSSVSPIRMSGEYRSRHSANVSVANGM